PRRADRAATPPATAEKRSLARTRVELRARLRLLASLLREIAVAREAALSRESVHAREKALQAREVRLAFAGHELVPVLLPRGAPELRDHLRRGRHVLAGQELEARAADQTLVLSGRHEEVPPDGAAGDELFP